MLRLAAMEKTKSKKTVRAEKIEPEKTGKMAVAIIGGKQHVLHEGEILSVQSLNEKVGNKVSDFDVLFYAEEDKYYFGTPVLKDSKVEVEVLEDFKGKKIDVIKFKAKSRYSKKRGYRSVLTRIKVLKILGDRNGA